MYMQMKQSIGFDWDDGNLAKCQKHGVSIVDIQALLGGEDAHIGPDPHAGEERFRAVGRNAGGRMVFVVFTLRRNGEQAMARPVSARFMHQKEVASYEKAISGIRL